MMTPGPFGPSPAGLTAMTRAWRPRRSCMVLEADAYALVTGAFCTPDGDNQRPGITEACNG